MYQRIDHIGIIVADIRSSIAWYVDNLDWVLQHDEYIADVGAQIVHLLPGPQKIEDDATSLQLVQPIEPGPLLDHLKANGEGLHHICFEVSDINEEVSRFGDDPSGIFKGRRDMFACFLSQSPDGVLIELTGHARNPVNADQI